MLSAVSRFSVIYYDKYGRVTAAISEAENTSFQAQPVDEVEFHRSGVSGRGEKGWSVFTAPAILPLNPAGFGGKTENE